MEQLDEVFYSLYCYTLKAEDIFSSPQKTWWLWEIEMTASESIVYIKDRIIKLQQGHVTTPFLELHEDRTVRNVMVSRKILLNREVLITDGRTGWRRMLFCLLVILCFEWCKLLAA